MCKIEQVKAEHEGIVRPDKAYHVALKYVYNNAFRTETNREENTQSMANKGAQLPGTGTRELGCEQTRRMIRAYFIPRLRLALPCMASLCTPGITNPHLSRLVGVWLFCLPCHTR
jgi:hypothetical protein